MSRLADEQGEGGGQGHDRQEEAAVAVSSEKVSREGAEGELEAAEEEDHAKELDMLRGQ